LALSDGYIGMIEANVTPPNARLIKLIVSEFGVNKTWLQTGEGEMFAAPEMDEKAARLVGLFNGLPPGIRRWSSASLTCSERRRNEHSPALTSCIKNKDQLESTFPLYDWDGGGTMKLVCISCG
jgi:hypothetical protein